MINDKLCIKIHIINSKKGRNCGFTEPCSNYFVDFNEIVFYYYLLFSRLNTKAHFCGHMFFQLDNFSPHVPTWTLLYRLALVSGVTMAINAETPPIKLNITLICIMLAHNNKIISNSVFILYSKTFSFLWTFKIHFYWSTLMVKTEFLDFKQLEIYTYVF